MSLLLYFASGIPFVLGAALCALAPLLARVERPAARRGGRAFVIAGLLLISLSATPMPLWLASAGAIAGLAWLLVGVRRSRRAPRVRLALDAALAVLSLLALALELPHQLMPRLEAGNLTRLCVIGDSLSAGIRDGERTWPRVLAETHGLNVSSLARAGATTDDARRQAEALPENAGVVMILIGGNDVLNGRSSADFERNLNAAVATASRKAAAVVMLELPVPPLANRFTAIQRDVARRHRAHLIPKRVLALLLADSANTSDGLHLSTLGHERLSEVVWRTVRPAMRAGEIVSGPTPAPATIRLVTWNVQKCEGGIERVAETLESLAPDIACLQELIEPRGLSGGVDQHEQLRRKLGMHAYSFGGPLDAARNQSIAILSR
ncbi:MAG: GDSL-type esterase/lipase family protein [Phycisphaerae bacterium]